MSAISNRHMFVPFHSGKTKPFDGQRLAKVGYKKKSGKQSVAVSIPKLSDSEVEIVATAFPINQRKRVEGFQDDLIRSLKETGKVEIASDEISVQSIISFQSTVEAGRLTIDAVGKWFDMQDTDTFISDTYSLTVDNPEHGKRKTAWRAQFCAVVGKAVASNAVLNKLLECIAAVCEEDDPTANLLAEKITAIITERIEAESALG